MVLRWHRTKVYRKASSPGNRKVAGAPKHLRWVYSEPKLQISIRQFQGNPVWQDVPLVTEEIESE